MAAIIWTDEMVSAVTRFRAQGMTVDMIAEKIGVDRETFRRFRALGGVQVTPLRKSKSTLVGMYRGPELTVV